MNGIAQKVKVRIVGASARKEQYRAFKHGHSSVRRIHFSSQDDCKDCREGKRGHSGGTASRVGDPLSKRGKNPQELLIGMSDISRSIEESLRLRKTLRLRSVRV